MSFLARVEKVSLLIVAFVLLLMLAIPALRIFFVASIHSLAPTGDRNIWVGRADPEIAGPKSDAQLTRENPRDYLLRLGIAVSSKYEDSDRAFNSLIHDFPHEPSAYALAMNAPVYHNFDFERVEQYGVTPEIAAKEYKEMMKSPWPKLRSREENLRRIDSTLPDERLSQKVTYQAKDKPVKVILMDLCRHGLYRFCHTTPSRGIIAAEIADAHRISRSWLEPGR
jgi:hypothetical protein